MIKYLLVFMFMIYIFQRIKPAKDLKLIDAESFYNLILVRPEYIKVLDVRDQVDYYADHIAGAMNISLGRLPYVKKDELNHGDEIIIIADSKYHSKKAVKILKKCGFENLTYLKNGMQSYHQIEKKHHDHKRASVLKRYCI